MDSLDELSEEQRHMLVQFQEVTGIEDLNVATYALEEHSWNVEAAVQHQLAIHDSPDQFESSSTVSSSYSSPVVNGGENVLRARSSSPSDTQVDEGGGNSEIVQRNQGFWSLFRMSPSQGGFFGWWCYLLALPVRLALFSISTFFYFISRIILPTSRIQDPVGDVIGFITEFEEDYGLSHPSFFRGSYSQALSAAKTQLKFLLVYLHCSDHQDTSRFCRSTLSDPVLIDYINATLIFWAASVKTSEGYRVSHSLRENSYPFLAMIVLRENRMTVVGRVEGHMEPQELLTRLRAIVSDNEGYLFVARTERQERQRAALLRQEQDNEYLKSLRADQEKERRRQEEQRLLEEEMRKEAQKEEDRHTLRSRKLSMACHVPEEPSEGAEDVIHIVVKLPCGTRLERRFLMSQSLKVLYYYIFCHPDSPDRFQVRTDFPRKVVPCVPTPNAEDPPTFEEFKMPQRSMLLVQDLNA